MGTSKITLYETNSGEFNYEALLDCPFCGGTANIIFIGNDYSKRREVIIKCSKCQVEMHDAALRLNTETLAKTTIDRWNTRIK